MGSPIQPPENQYSRRIGTDHPGLILILVDQSYSMSENNKAKDAALAVNRVIYEIVLASQSGTEVKDRCYLGVIGYGSTIKPVSGGMISKISESPIGIEKLKQKVSDGAGGLVEIEVERPYWVEPVADNGTPMAEALEKAYEVASNWANQNQDSFPPIVINITDGEPNDYSGGTAPDTKSAVGKLMDVSTKDGGLLIFNAHFQEKQELRLYYRHLNLNLPIPMRDYYSRYLLSYRQNWWKLQKVSVLILNLVLGALYSTLIPRR